MTIGIVTAVYDHYDTLKPMTPQSIAADAVCVTDDLDLMVDGWRMVYQPRPDHPNLAAKFPKCAPWRFTPAERSVWIDASYRVTSQHFAAEVERFVDRVHPIAMFAHPWRDCIYEEVLHSMGLAKYLDQPLEAQAERYRDRGHPEHWGLWAGGVIVRLHTPDVRALGLAWISEMLEWSYQDQVSLPPMLRELDLRPVLLPGTHITNGWLSYEASARH